MKLNLGSGKNRFTDYINIDVEFDYKPDLICDFTKGFLPFKSNTIEKVTMFHTIEHIEKKNHKNILSEVNRILIENGIFIISYPEWVKCVQNYLDNKYGKRDFWEATLYGRQTQSHDYHVCIMDTDRFIPVVHNYGFEVVKQFPEKEDYNTVLVLQKRSSPLTYEKMLRGVVWQQEMQ